MNDAFRQKYVAVAEELLLHLPDECGLSEVELAAGEGRLGIKLPLALRDYFLALGKLPLNVAHNRTLAAAKWFINDGKLIFMEENQWVVYWGVGASQTPEIDPPVFLGINRLPKQIEWLPDMNAISDFLVLMLHYQAAMGGFERVVSGEVEPSMLAHFDSHWRFGGEFNGLIAFRRRGEVACFLGARTDASLEMFAGTVSEARYGELSSTLQGLGIEYDEL
jgi:hypothetical protein